jgi:5'-phosphate synthase pdxT subunit
MKVGVLALQGDFAEHIAVLRRLGVEAVEVRLPGHLEGLAGLIIPGGESTTIGMLAERYGLLDALREFGRHKALWGTCAGLIFLARDIGRAQPLLGLMDIKVARNAFGRQVDSFEIDISIRGIDDSKRPFHAIFIRAPAIEEVGPQATVLASLPQDAGPHAGKVVAARQGHLLATAFHPELTQDDRIHRLFLRLAEGGA